MELLAFEGVMLLKLFSYFLSFSIGTCESKTKSFFGDFNHYILAVKTFSIFRQDCVLAGFCCTFSLLG
jgi:hypothetical protein